MRLAVGINRPPHCVFGSLFPVDFAHFETLLLFFTVRLNRIYRSFNSCPADETNSQKKTRQERRVLLVVSVLQSLGDHTGTLSSNWSTISYYLFKKTEGTRNAPHPRKGCLNTLTRSPDRLLLSRPDLCRPFLTRSCWRHLQRAAKLILTKSINALSNGLKSGRSLEQGRQFCEFGKGLKLFSVPHRGHLISTSPVMVFFADLTDRRQKLRRRNL